MASGVEDFVKNIVSFSNQKKFVQLNEFMMHHYETLMKNPGFHDSILEPLNIFDHTLGIAHILCAKAATISITTSLEALMQTIQHASLFATQCDSEQLKLVESNFASIFHYITQELVTRKIPIRGINLMCLGIDRLQNNNSSRLTSIHADLCQLCLAAKCFKPALKYLDVEISEIGGNKDHPVSSFHFLSYYYYGGMIYTALKRFNRALYFFEQAVTCPCQMISLIVVEAYKKYILVCLIHEGRFVQLPKYTSLAITRWAKSYLTDYMDLVHAYAQGSVIKLNALVVKNEGAYRQDENTGLVKQVVASLNKRNIQKLTKTFITLSLEDVVTRANLSFTMEQVEKLLTRMIEDGEIFACIDQRSKMVKFFDDPEQYNSSSTLDSINRQINDFMDISAKMKEMTQSIMTNPIYLNKTKPAAAPNEEDLEGRLTSSSAATPLQTFPNRMDKLLNFK